VLEPVLTGGQDGHRVAKIVETPMLAQQTASA
jgi:hypothetical protein